MANAPHISSAPAVANYFLDKYWQNPSSIPAVDQMKLQKLVYYAHAWFLAFYDLPLFEEDIEAWPWGPVVRDIYNQTRGHGRAPIQTKIRQLDSAGNIIEPLPEHEDTQQFLDSVWETCAGYTGVQLSNATHAVGEPWEVVDRQFGTDCKPTIPNDLIKSIFKKKLAQNDQQQNTAAT